MSQPQPNPENLNAPAKPEFIVDLRRLGLRLLQRRDYFGFTEDSHFLAEFVGARPACHNIGDLGSGGGGLLLLLWAQNQQAQCYGLEILPENVALAERSLALNASIPGISQNCHFILGDWRRPDLYFAPQSFDLLVSNPPYWPPGKVRPSPVLQRAAARTELFGSLAELILSAKWLLRPTGSLALIIPLNRRAELKQLLIANGFNCQREAEYKQLFLIEAQKQVQNSD